jgi:hypothetical protein
METHHAVEKAEEAHHHDLKHADPFNKRVAILITVLAAILAIIEMGGKSAQTNSMAANIEASNLWAFFQAKSIRQTVMRTAADQLDAMGGLSDRQTAAVAKWRQTADRYETEPSTNEGRKELAARAKTAEARRDKAAAAYHLFEFASAALQLAIVLASSAVITSLAMLAFVSAGLGAVGGGLALLAWLAPTALHL